QRPQGVQGQVLDPQLPGLQPRDVHEPDPPPDPDCAGAAASACGWLASDGWGLSANFGASRSMAGNPASSRCARGLSTTSCPSVSPSRITRNFSLLEPTSTSRAASFEAESRSRQ